ncbi:hypothetical protein L1887_11811 [Cichorium endivia]|nr:hypothetical protein L1887_11811 [Cichorium endivia]
MLYQQTVFIDVEQLLCSIIKIIYKFLFFFFVGKSNSGEKHETKSSLGPRITKTKNSQPSLDFAIFEFSYN